MIAIRQFVESLALGLGVGFLIVVCALYILESKDSVHVEPAEGRSGLSSPSSQSGHRRDEDGVPLRLDGSVERQDVSAG